MSLQPQGTYHLAVGSAEFGNGIRNAQRQVAATVLNTRAAAVAMDFADTDRTPYDTGTFASAGVSVGAVAVQKAVRDVMSSRTRKCQPWVWPAEGALIASLSSSVTVSRETGRSGS